MENQVFLLGLDCLIGMMENNCKRLAKLSTYMWLGTTHDLFIERTNENDI